jgi:DnaJ domain
MALTRNEVEELNRNYNLLDVPISATAQGIRLAYHGMVKRWHPDLYPNGSREQAEATQMMKLVNEAYARIQHAPLRYHIESYPKVKSTRARVQANYRSAQVQFSWPRREDLPITDRMEYWVRFVCGALLGLLISTWAMVIFSNHAFLALSICIVVTLACALSAAREGDRFWYRILAFSWRWY